MSMITHLSIGVFVQPGRLARVYLSKFNDGSEESRPVMVVPVSDGLDELIESVGSWLEAQASIALGQETLPGFPPAQ